MKGKRKILIALLSGLILLACATGVFAGVTLTPIWTNPVQYSPPGSVGEFIPRSIDVNPNNGDIYIASDKTAPSQVVKISAAGAVVARWGPTLSNSVNFDLILCGVAIDPLTNYAYISVNSGGMIYALDTTQPTGNGIVIAGKDISTGLTRPGGLAISHDGMKLAVIGYVSNQNPGNVGIKLYSRNLNGTPADYTDDTFIWEADMLQPGNEFLGLGEYYCTPEFTTSTPRDCGFSNDGSIVYACENRSIIKYSATSPYGVVDALGTMQSRWGVDVDESNNVVSGTGTADPVTGTCTVLFQDVNTGMRLGQSNTTNPVFAKPDNVAWDGVNHRLIVAGDYTPPWPATRSGYVQCYTVTLPDPATDLDFYPVTGTVKTAGGVGIANAKIGILNWTFISADLTAPRFNGSSFAATTDASGNFSVYLPAWFDAKPLVVDVEATGYLKQRQYGVIMDGPADTLDIVLKPQAETSITWNAPASIGAGVPGGTDRITTEDGLVQHMARFGSRAAFATDPVFAQNCYKIGANEDTAGSLDNYLVLNIDDNWVTPGSTVWVTVEYLDYVDILDATDGWDALSLEADCGAVLGTKWIGTTCKFAPQSSAWETKTFKITNTAFGNRIMTSGWNNSVYGYVGPTPAFADIRVSANKDLPYNTHQGPDWIKRVTVSKVAPSPPAGTYTSIKDAKGAGTGNPVVMNDQIITSQWGGSAFYVEDTARTNGLKISLGAAGIADLANSINDPISFEGKLQVEGSGELYVLADTYSTNPSATATEIRPLGVIGRTINNLAGLPGMTGLRVKATGKVASVVPSVKDVSDGSFTIDDGSGAVKVVMDKATVTNFWPLAGDYVAVDGIATLDGTSPSAVRAIKPWSTSVGPGNGGFEDTVPLNGWVTNIWCDGTIAIDSITVHAGVNSLKFTNNTPYYTPGQYLTAFRADNILVTGQKYLLSVFAKATANGSTNNELYDWEDPFYLLGLPAGTYDWKLVSRTFTAPYAALETRFIIQDTATELFVDDISYQYVAGSIQILNR